MADFVGGSAQVNTREIGRLMEECDKAKKRLDEIRSRYVASGPVGPGGEFPKPERWLDTAGLQEMQEAERKYHAALEELHESLRRAYDRYRMS